MSAAEALAKLIRQRYDQTGSASRYPTEGSLAEFILEHAAEVGLAVIQLPQPDSTRYEGDEHEPMDRLSWLTNEFEAAVWNEAEVQLNYRGDGEVWGIGEPVHVSEVKRLAAALLAAAAAAERVSA